MNTSHEIVFVGMSKNCLNNSKKNLEFLKNYKSISKHNIKICVIESDSTDGSKEYFSNLKQSNGLDFLKEIDNLENTEKSRISRLAICRNEALKYIKTHYKKDLIYIPMDFDIDLFKLTKPEDFNLLINYFVNQSHIDCMFPFSLPFYYDIFALRSKNWVEKNNIYKSKLLKERFKIGSVFFNYFLVFRKQLSINSFNKSLIPVESAFGGMGMYKINQDLIKKIKYRTSKKCVSFVSEHVFFNKYFENLFIYKNWQIEAPYEYIFWNTLNFRNKLLFIFKSLKHDFNQILSK